MILEILVTIILVGIALSIPAGLTIAIRGIKKDSFMSESYWDITKEVLFEELSSSVLICYVIYLIFTIYVMKVFWF